MNRILALVAALTTLVAMPQLAAAQPNAGEAAEAAQQVATRAAGVFERIDPDAEMPQAQSVADAPALDEAAMVYAGLPPLSSAIEAPTEPDTFAAQPAPRGPAVRMIAKEVVQPLPAPVPVPVPAPMPVPVAAPAPPPAPVATPAATDLASKDPFVIKSILPIEGSIRYGDWFWDETAAPTAGKLVITVDLEARVISAFRDGHEIGTAVALLGTQEHPTPLGSFPILTKEKDNVSEKYDNAPMPHTLRLTWDGIAIHGSPVLNGYASHGCIGVPDDFAAKLYAAAKRGDRVIITRGKMIGIGDKVL